MGLDNIEVEKHLVEHEILRMNMSLTFVPYIGATADVDLGLFNLTTLGLGTFGPSASDRVILGTPNSTGPIIDVVTAGSNTFKFGDATNFLEISMSDISTSLISNSTYGWDINSLGIGMRISAGSTVTTYGDSGYSLDGNGDIRTSLGIGTFGTTNDQITLNDATSKMHIYGNTTSDYAIIDTGINYNLVVKPAYPSMVNLGAGNVDIGEHHYQVEFYTAWGGTGVANSSGSPSITIAGSSAEVEVTIPVSADYRVIGRRIYRTKAGASNFTEYLLVDIANNVDTTYNDNIADASLPADRAFAYTLGNKSVPMILVDDAVALVMGEGSTSLGFSTGVAGGGVSIGDYAGEDLQDAALNNTLIGSQSGRNLTTGGTHTLVGMSSGFTLTTQANNTMVGWQSGQLATGENSVLIGINAGRYGSGSYNILIGANAGNISTLGTSARNIGIGYNALKGLNNASFSYNIAMGWQAGNAITTGTYNVILGHDSDPSSATADREFVVSEVDLFDCGMGRDSVKHYFGAARDAYIEFDGDSMNIVANAVTATDALEITADHTKFTGGRIDSTVRITGVTTLDSTHHIVFADTDGGAFVITLPTGVEGTNYKIINVGTSGNDITITPDGAETIYGSVTEAIIDGEIFNIHFNSTEGWW